jgi:hypothetical protein
MRQKGIKIVGLLVLCALVLVVGGTGATAGEKEKPGLAGAGHLKDGNGPGGFTEDAYCESGCCWASCSGAPDCSVSCSSSGCSASGGGQSASVLCDAQ